VGAAVTAGIRIMSHAWLVAAVAAVTVGTAGCASGPSTKSELCASFNTLDQQLLKGNGVFGNPLFRAADDLGDVAARYPDATVSRDGAALHKIADSDSTSGGELMDATGHIANVCGHPLGLGALFGGR
jgi:hypothetical protein